VVLVANIRFTHSKVAATLHCLHQLPKRGTHTALSPLMRLRMCWSCVFTQALENLPYLRSFSADSAYYLFRIRTQDQNIIPTQEPRPNGVPQTQYGDRRCPLCPGRHLGSESHLYLSCTVTSPLAHPLISELRIRFPWDGFTQQQQMALLLGTMPQDPVAQRHKQWFGTILPQCHALAARITLTVQKELQMLAVQTGVSAGQLRAAASASQGVAGGALIQIPSPMTMISEDEE